MEMWRRTHLGIPPKKQAVAMHLGIAAA
jgi:hypothetical protein